MLRKEGGHLNMLCVYCELHQRLSILAPSSAPSSLYVRNQRKAPCVPISIDVFRVVCFLLFIYLFIYLTKILCSNLNSDILSLGFVLMVA